MFLVANDILYTQPVVPFIDGGGLLAPIQGVSGGGLIFTIGYPQPLETSATIGALIGNLATIDTTGLSLQNVAALEISGVRYSPGVQPSDLAVGEFFWDEANNQIIIKTC